MGKLRTMKNATFKRQFMISIILVLVLSLSFTVGGLVLELWLINKEIILRANYYSSEVPKIEEYINKNKDKILNENFKKELENKIPTAGIEYEVVDSKGTLSYGYFKKPIVSKISMTKEKVTKTNGWINTKVIKYIPVLDNNELKGMVILKYYIGNSVKNPNYNWLVAYSDLYVFLAPFVYIILFSVFFAGRFNKKINIPLKQLMEGAEKIRVRDLEFNITYESNNELGKLCKSFEDMRIDLKKSLESQWRLEEERREMVGAVAHDLKTPITIIKGHVEGLLESKELDSYKLYKYLNLINKNTDRMTKLVGRINLLTKIENVDFKLNAKECDLVDHIKELSMDYNILVQDKKINFTCKIEDFRNSNSLIRIDTYALSEILDNLMSNSVRFTPEGGNITLSLKLYLDKMIFSISDTGCGFSKKDTVNIFKKFYQGDESRSMEKNHAGLGLYIVKTLVSKFNGFVKAKNNVEGGGEVIIFIPY
ncbi:sensor histidine kinase [Clostridium estertheticum]|uniref:HAMP domain-containing sensor histidine kinase n=1 Tax=Clostridium estertheticum TaxID=238834 RepID=UPI00209AD041|nr:sensor histidine kinase [Clostridium estertheticum]WAG56765.1 sensor histidine kinase [Clostridium estertheticum]